MSVPGEQSQVRARGGHTKPNGEEGSAPSDLNVAPSHENLHLVKGISIQMGQGHGVYITELDKSGNVTQRWLHTPDNQVIQVVAKDKSNDFFSRSMREWRKAISDAFLPVGFPHSVSSDYLAYQTYDSLQAFFSTITSLLANRALLQGLGVGDANSSATFAMLLTILKDAMSRVATIVFAQQFGLQIEPDAKRYRFLADLFNDTAFFLELYSPYFGPLGKVVALTTGEALRALCGVAAGASKAALSMHFAKHDNLAELNAKEASQETAVGLIGLLVGTLVVKFIEDHRSVVYLMTVLVFGHLWMNYLGVRSVEMNTLNRQRATILFEEYLKTGKVLSPNEIAQREHILLWRPVVRNRHGQAIARIEMAESYWGAMGGSRQGINIAMVDGARHTLFIWSHAREGLIPIKLLLWKGSTSADAIHAWFMAMEIAWLMEAGKGYTDKLDRVFCITHPTPVNWKIDGVEEDPDDRSLDGYKKCYNSRLLWDTMASKGWNLDAQAFETAAPVRIVAEPQSTKDE